MRSGLCPGADKDVRQLARKARKQGFVVEVLSGGHIRWTNPRTGDFCHGHKTASDWRSLKDLKKRLRQIGLKGV